MVDQDSALNKNSPLHYFLKILTAASNSERGKGGKKRGKDEKEREEWLDLYIWYKNWNRLENPIEGQWDSSAGKTRTT